MGTLWQSKIELVGRYTKLAGPHGQIGLKARDIDDRQRQIAAAQSAVAEINLRNCRLSRKFFNAMRTASLQSKIKKPLKSRAYSSTGGSGEIRTHERVAPSAVFKTAAFNRSATLPECAALYINHAGLAARRPQLETALLLHAAHLQAARSACPGVQFSRSARSNSSAGSGCENR